MKTSAHSDAITVPAPLAGWWPRYDLAVIGTIVALVAIRLVVAGTVPLAFDEALYWRWSTNLAAGYYDHPPMTPLLIRLGTTLFGQDEFGVRALGVLLSIPATGAVWRSADILFDDGMTGATAALLFNATLTIGIGSILMTPDSPLVVASCFLLFCLVKLQQSGRPQWWLAIGLVFGLGMLSKYTMVFFSVSILAWLLLVPEQRRWLLTPWPWLSGALALAVFSPVLIWNAEHGWASVVYQSQRLVVHEVTLRYFFEFLGSQVGLATPPIFVLGCMGLIAFIRGDGGSRSARVLIGACAWPLLIYFTLHSLKGRVEGNWPEPLYPAFVVAAAVAAKRIEWSGAWTGIAMWAHRLAAPLGIGTALAVYLQAVFGVIPMGRTDPTARTLGAGWPALAAEIDRLRKQVGAPIILTVDYGVASWLAFYLPSKAPVEQINVRIRWVDAPVPDPALFQGSMMFVCRVLCQQFALVLARFEVVELVETLIRSRNGVEIDRYQIYRLSGPTRAPLDIAIP